MSHEAQGNQGKCHVTVVPFLLLFVTPSGTCTKHMGPVATIGGTVSAAACTTAAPAGPATPAEVFPVHIVQPSVATAAGPAVPLHILHTVARQGKTWQVPHKCLARWLHRLGWRYHVDTCTWEVSRASVHHYSLAGLHSATDTAMTATAG